MIRLCYQFVSAPHKPHNLTLKSVTADTLTVTWSAPKHTPSPIEQYVIEYRSLFQMKDIKSLMSPSTKREVTIPKLSENTTYKVAVKAMVKRTRDKRSLFGESASAIFRTSEYECYLYTYQSSGCLGLSVTAQSSRIARKILNIVKHHN